MTLILGIESSCDETAAAVVADGKEVLSSCISSQIAKHAPFGGVVPELAAREHLINIQPIVHEALSKAFVDICDLDAIAVTNGPGLLPSLVIGVNFSKAMAMANKKPLIGINHFQAHIYGAFLDSDIQVLSESSSYPIAALVVSGGHTAIVIIQESGKARIVGSTLDDAAGEAFDKAAKLLGLGYPGGPIIEKRALDGNAGAFFFPRPMTGSSGKALKPENRFDFSFSGLKTSLLYHCRKQGLINADGNMTGNISVCENASSTILSDTIASYQEAIIDVLSVKFLDAVNEFGAKTAVVCGGVACNSALRQRIEKSMPENINITIASPKYCTDNAAMIAGLAYQYYMAGLTENSYMDAYTRLNSEEMYIPLPIARL